MNPAVRITIKINLNDPVLVKLNEHGRRIMQENHDVLLVPGEFHPKAEDADGFSSWQLWELMQEFGPHLYNGCTVPFDTTIELRT